MKTKRNSFFMNQHKVKGRRTRCRKRSRWEGEREWIIWWKYVKSAVQFGYFSAYHTQPCIYQMRLAHNVHRRLLFWRKNIFNASEWQQTKFKSVFEKGKNVAHVQIKRNNSLVGKPTSETSFKMMVPSCSQHTGSHAIRITTTTNNNKKTMEKKLYRFSLPKTCLI